MSEVNEARHNAVVRARRAINDLAAASCDCPYETERELASEIDKLRRERELEFDRADAAELEVEECTKLLMAALGERNVARVEAQELRVALAEAIGWSYGDLVTPERRNELEGMTVPSQRSDGVHRGA